MRRPIYLIEKDIKEYQEKSRNLLARRNFAELANMTRIIRELQDEYDKALIDIKYEEDTKNMNRHLRSFVGKILSLSLNEADLAIYHIDMFFAYMKEKDLQPKDEWEHARLEVKKAISTYRDFMKNFFRDETNLVSNEIDFMHLAEYIKTKMFTDREQIYYDEYEVKAARKQTLNCNGRSST